MKNFKAPIFDMDGVVVANHQYHYQAWVEFCKKYQYTLSPEIYRDRFNGKTNADLFKMIFGDISSHKVKEYADEKEGLYKELYAPHMVAHKGLIDYLDYLVANKIKIALGTSAPTEN